MYGAGYRTNAHVARSRGVILPLADGEPSDACPWLMEGLQWLNFSPLGRRDTERSPDSENELLVDPGADPSRLAAQEEGAQLEYKVNFPDTSGERRTVFTSVTLANGGGGPALFGVDDGGAVVGLKGNLLSLADN